MFLRLYTHKAVLGLLRLLEYGRLHISKRVELGEEVISHYVPPS